MSTMIEIIPTLTTEITFGQVIDVSEKYIHDFLNSIGVERTIQLQINIHETNEKYIREIQMTDKFEWKENEYVWFSIQGVAGGTDAYCDKLKDTFEPDEPWWRLEDLTLNNKTIDQLPVKLEGAKKLDRKWSFRRSAGQPGIIALSYGLIAAAVAELTGGILQSDDGAWDYERFPAESNDFLGWYFQPEKALAPENADWAQRCLNGIEEELDSANMSPPKRSWLSKLFGS